MPSWEILVNDNLEHVVAVELRRQHIARQAVVALVAREHSAGESVVLVSRDCLAATGECVQVLDTSVRSGGIAIGLYSSLGVADRALDEPVLLVLIVPVVVRVGGIK